MLSGYNHNVKYACEVYHVQTEDFGQEKAYFLTQIFLGGTLITKERYAYTLSPDKGETPAFSDPLRALMRQFHAQMIDNLKAGHYTESSKPLVADAQSTFVSAEDVDAFVLKNFSRVPI